VPRHFDHVTASLPFGTGTFCVGKLDDQLVRFDHPGGGILRRHVGGGAGQARQAEIFNTDQGSQFAGAAFTGLLIKNGIAISMDGKGAWRDNVFV
jgi:transposase InsO family protein